MKNKFDHNFFECIPPYYECPYCHGELTNKDVDEENSVMTVNDNVYDIDWGRVYEWQEIYKCPHCGNLFYIQNGN